MNAIITEMEQTLRHNYPSGFGAVFIGEAQDGDLTLEEFKDNIQAMDIAPPESFYAYYDWLLRVQFPSDDVSDKTELGYDDEHYTPSLDNILSTTREWREIQKKQPDREWKSGFLAIASWNSCYQLVIDTHGDVAPKGSLLVWDFKGGGEYEVVYQSFESYVKTKLELLKAMLYFPPSPSDDEAYEDFMYGATREKINKLIADLNGEPQIVPF